MKLKIMFIGIVLLVLFLFLSSSTVYQYDRRKAPDYELSRPTITEEGKISALLCCLEQDIREQRKEGFPFYFVYPFSSDERTFEKSDDLINSIDTLFERSKRRENDKLFIRKTPSVENLTTTWDFQIDDVEIKIRKDRAIVKCNLIFYAAYPDTSDTIWKAPGRRTKAEITFVKRGNTWQISNVNKLLRFIEDVTEEQLSILDKSDKRLEFDPGKSKHRDILRRRGGVR